ncbi:hypothetical protein C8R46DRAFT_614441 [Mycena filopes]|nr:hypothetical protein C8R46DRAFT_614441 [Mycena filopes]
MHPALQIVEVVELICAEVVPPDHEFCVHVSQALSRLARTSSIFLDPALNLLWRRQDTIVNLLRVMPDDLWMIEEVEREDDEDSESDDEDSDKFKGPTGLEISLNRPVTHSDWNRFLFYARRVKTFTTTSYSPPAFHGPEVYEILTMSFPEQYLFPHLQKLEWDPMLENCFHHVRFFLTPSLTELDLSIETTAQLSIFSTLTLNCTRLTRLALRLPAWGPHQP